MRAGYTFVPLDERVFFPDWAVQVSHDLPFRDGLSGEISYEVEAESPIYIRNSNTINRESDLSFNHYVDELGAPRYFIPGTSMKGMIRSIAEVLSFSKLSQLNDGRFSFRDFDNKELYPLIIPGKSKEIRCGWLSMDESGSWVIEDHGKPLRISHQTIDAHFGSDFVKSFCDRGTATDRNSTIREEAKSGAFKYQKLEGCDLNGLFVSEGRTNITVAHYSENGDIEGTLVLSGQASVRKADKNGKPSGKFYEFVFPTKPNGSLPLSEEQREDFLFQAHDKDAEKISPDWKYWKAKMKGGVKMPVFFRVEGKKVKDFGLTMMYRLPYKHRIKDLRAPNHSDLKLDMADTLFGYIREKENLRGRIQFSHAFAQGSPKEMPLVKGVLGSPRASYYPNYIRQDGAKVLKYHTFQDKQARLSGRKFYPVHSGGAKELAQGNGNEKIMTSFRPLASGTKFRGKVRYHNLKPQELGLLLSALSFHGQKACRHALGMAKGYGFGRVKLSIEELPNEQLTASLRAFEALIMESHLSASFTNTPQFKELIALHLPAGSDVELGYMDLEAYGKEKLAKIALSSIQTRIPDRKCVVQPLVSSADLEKIQADRKRALLDEEMAKLQTQQKEQQEIAERKRVAEEEKNQAAHAQKLEAGLSGLSGVESFKKGMNVVANYLKVSKMEQLELSQQEELYQFLLRMVNNPHKDDKGEFAKPFEKANYWRNMAKWVGAEQAKVWYNEAQLLMNK